MDIRNNARATALLVSDPYTVTGIQYEEKNGDVVHINAKAVILATGGMSTNKELLGQYSSQDMEKIIGWGEGQDGDGHLMAEQTAHGRANHLTVDSLFNNVGNGDESLAYSSPLGVSAAMQYSDCFVNEYGERFCDESGGGGLGTSESGKLIEAQGYVFSIMDADNIAAYEAGGCTRHYSGFADACVSNPIDLQSELEQYDGVDYIWKADSVKELGQAIAKSVPFFDVDAFVAEIDAYNQYAESGTDEAYGKDGGVHLAYQDRAVLRVPDLLGHAEHLGRHPHQPRGAGDRRARQGGGRPVRSRRVHQRLGRRSVRRRHLPDGGHVGRQPRGAPCGGEQAGRHRGRRLDGHRALAGSLRGSGRPGRRRSFRRRRCQGRRSGAGGARGITSQV